MPEVIIIGEKDQAKAASDRDFGTRGERRKGRKVETEELARCPVPGGSPGPSRRVLWDGSTDPDEQARNEASRLARLRGPT
jgi:hypothetical protein